jgi:hypothetical protein|nr:MAG TPA: hypothetical protein [Caudoviricetes sp.]
MALFSKNDVADINEAVKVKEFSPYISESGIYDITIEAVVVSRNADKARSLNFLYDYNGNKGILWGLKLDNNDGKANFERNIFIRLATILGVDLLKVDEVAVATDQDPYFTYKKNAEAAKQLVAPEIKVLQDFEGAKVKVRIRRDISKYNGQIKKKFVIQDFYTTDGVHASEILDKSIPAGTQLAKDEKYAHQDKIDKYLTKEEVEAFLNGSKAATSTPSTDTSNLPF